MDGYSPFFRFLLKVTLALHLPFAVAIWHVASREVGLGPWSALAVSLAAVTGSMALAPGRIRGGLYDSHRPSLVTEGVDAPYFVHWCACVFAAVPSALALVLLPLSDLVRNVPVAFPSRAIAWAYLLSLLPAAWGVLLRRRWLRVHPIEIEIEGLPKSFEGYRIAHLSDLHIGSMTPKRRAARWVAAANRAQVDLALVTGDMVTNGVLFHEDIAEVLGALQAKDGAFVSMGNHDYFGEGEPLMSLLTARSVRVLRNEGVRLTRAGDTVYLAGVDDTFTGRADLAATLAGRASNEVTVLMAHDPSLFHDASERGVELVLSGHTHGGQVAMPFLGRLLSLSHLAHNFHVGLYRRGASTLYVHPGLGTTGPPVRLGTQPTVAILTLRCAR